MDKNCSYWIELNSAEVNFLNGKQQIWKNCAEHETL